jgi:hypothetical protein
MCAGGSLSELMARKEAALLMHSSATTGFRAFLMLACTVAVPAWAVWGASWSEIQKKFENLPRPAFLNSASASTNATASPGESPRLVRSSAVAVMTLPGNQGDSLAVAEARSGTAPLATAAGETARGPAVPSGCREIQDRLQKLGATYYVLESWGNDQQLYRFCCKMAVTDSPDYVELFEATHADPLRAMQQVLRDVETWRGGTQYGG